MIQNLIKALVVLGPKCKETEFNFFMFSSSGVF